MLMFASINDSWQWLMPWVKAFSSNEMKSKGTFDEVTVLKPYSFVLVDDEKETLAELLLMDDDTLLVNDELLKGLDEELDEFLKKLLE